MNKIQEIYLNLILEANWNFGSEFIKKGQFKDVAIYFQQNHVLDRISQRGDCTLSQLLKSTKKLIKILFLKNELKIFHSMENI